MFGGWGLSTDGLNIAIIAWDTLFLKVTPGEEGAWIAEGCRPFTYEAKGRALQLHYYTAPDSAMESPDLMAPWARRALESALRARAAASPRSRAAAGASRPARAGVTSKPATPSSSRVKAAPAKPSAKRKSSSG